MVRALEEKTQVINQTSDELQGLLTKTIEDAISAFKDLSDITREDRTWIMQLQSNLSVDIASLNDHHHALVTTSQQIGVNHARIAQNTSLIKRLSLSVDKIAQITNDYTKKLEHALAQAAHHHKEMQALKEIQSDKIHQLQLQAEVEKQCIVQLALLNKQLQAHNSVLQNRIDVLVQQELLAQQHIIQLESQLASLAEQDKPGLYPLVSSGISPLLLLIDLCLCAPTAICTAACHLYNPDKPVVYFPIAHVLQQHWLKQASCQPDAQAITPPIAQTHPMTSNTTTIVWIHIFHTQKIICRGYVKHDHRTCTVLDITCAQTRQIILFFRQETGGDRCMNVYAFLGFCVVTG